MKIEFRSIGKTSFAYLTEGVSIYEKRLKHYISYQSVIIPDIKNAKNLKPRQLKEKEGIALLNKIESGDFVIILDEKGKSYTSEKFAAFLEKQMLMSHKKVIFIVGGAFGFSEAVYARANSKLALSDMTFSHQMIRLFFTEQLYRACTIIKGEPYHNS